MKLFGNRHGGAGYQSNEDLPAPTDKSRRKKPGQVEIDDEYVGDYDETYDEDTYDDYDDAEDYEDGEFDDEVDGFDSDDDEDDYEDDDEYDDEEDKKRMSLKKKVLIGVICVLVLILGGIGFFVNYLLNLINYQAANSSYFATVSAAELLPEESPENSYLAQLEEEDEADTLEATASELEQWNEHIEDVTSDDSTYEVPISDDVYNILLLGSDTRVSGEVGRSDAMILVSINQKTETIYLTSFLRDSYVYIPGYGNTRLNHSFAYGGPALVEETLETNFKIHIDRYVAVDFYSFMDVVDTLGGVWIDVTEDEQKVTNQYIWSMNKLMGEEWSNDYLWTNGWMKLNGKQALCYARNRYTGNDYERTQRQRTIISQIINGAKESSPSTLVDLAQVILPQVTTDMTKSELLSYCANIAAYVNYDIVQQQIPVDGSYSGATISGMSVISLNLDKNIQYLQSTIYAGTEYGN
jgi:LCP family protein required for cell wall assembly